MKVNCAALPAELLESELFGHERGAFTGAATTRIGKFEQADTGTLMLDEIGEMKPALQAKLLHVLQDGEFTKLGSNKRVQVDVRIIAATNRDLEQMMMNGEFREDLYYRLKVIELIVPALKERRDEIATLCDFFVARYSRKYNRPARPISDQLRQLFMQYAVAGKHPRTRKHGQADRDPPGRPARRSRDRAEHPASDGGAGAGGACVCRRGRGGWQRRRRKRPADAAAFIRSGSRRARPTLNLPTRPMARPSLPRPAGARWPPLRKPRR